MKRYKVLAWFLSITLISASTLPIFADNENSIGSVKEDITNETVIGQDTTQAQKSEYTEAVAGDNATNIYATIASVFDVTIPKTIILDGKDKVGNYSVKIDGDIAGNESVVVIPEESFAMKQSGKEDVTASVEQDKTVWTYNQFDTMAVGTVTADGLSAGSWNGSFNFNISKNLINDIQEPEQIQYTEFELTADNYEMAGITREGDVIIPETFEYDGVNYKITSIGKSAFSECWDLTSIEIPNSVTIIKEEAFYDCDELYTVKMSNNVTTIENYAFWECDNLTNITLSNNITEIGKYAFCCTSIETITLPEKLTTIREGLFEDCRSLKTVEIQENVTQIDLNAFSFCVNLTDVVIPDNVTNIAENAFYEVPHITYNGTATGSPWGALSIN